MVGTKRNLNAALAIDAGRAATVTFVLSRDGCDAIGVQWSLQLVLWIDRAAVTVSYGSMALLTWLKVIEQGWIYTLPIYDTQYSSLILGIWPDSLSLDVFAYFTNSTCIVLFGVCSPLAAFLTRAAKKKLLRSLVNSAEHARLSTKARVAVTVVIGTDSDIGGGGDICSSADVDPDEAHGGAVSLRIQRLSNCATATASTVAAGDGVLANGRALQRKAGGGHSKSKERSSAAVVAAAAPAAGHDYLEEASPALRDFLPISEMPQIVGFIDAFTVWDRQFRRGLPQSSGASYGGGGGRGGGGGGCAGTIRVADDVLLIGRSVDALVDKIREVSDG